MLSCADGGLMSLDLRCLYLQLTNPVSIRDLTRRRVAQVSSCNVREYPRRAAHSRQGSSSPFLCPCNTRRAKSRDQDHLHPLHAQCLAQKATPDSTHYRTNHSTTWTSRYLVGKRNTTRSRLGNPTWCIPFGSNNDASKRQTSAKPGVEIPRSGGVQTHLFVPR